MEFNLKKLEEIFKIGAGTVKPCPLPDVDPDGEKAIEHVNLIRIEPQPPKWKYDEEDNRVESEGFAKSMWRKFSKGELINNDGSQMTKKQLQELLKKLEN